ncbi:YHYH domain-containing protein [uncultured Actinobacillus sp.]|nr:YHYH domain-containing protein [uncultured Actinobacillus sp.]
MKKLALVMLAMVTATSVFAHGGGLDKNGCHTDRKTGIYHCH